MASNMMSNIFGDDSVVPTGLVLLFIFPEINFWVSLVCPYGTKLLLISFSLEFKRPQIYID